MLQYELKGVNDEEKEDENPHNNSKYDHTISDELSTTTNAKISPESAKVAQLTEEIGMLEEDSAERKSNKSKLFYAIAAAGGQEPTSSMQSNNRGH